MGSDLRIPSLLINIIRLDLMGLCRLDRAVEPLFRVVEPTAFSRSFGQLKAVLSRADRSFARRRVESLSDGHVLRQLSCEPFGKVGPIPNSKFSQFTVSSLADSVNLEVRSEG